MRNAFGFIIRLLENFLKFDEKKVFCVKNELTRELFEVALKELCIKMKKMKIFFEKSKIGSRCDMRS